MTGHTAPPVGRRLAAGIGAQGLSQLAQILGQLLSVPVFLASWGSTRYADWLVLSAAAGMIGLADFGLHGHLSNSLRAAWARSDEGAGRRILQSGLGSYAILTALVGAAVCTAMAGVDVPAQLGVASLEDACPTLLLLAMTTIVLLPRGLVATVHSARGHFHREVVALMLAQSAQTGAGIAAALAGGTPLYAAAAQLAAALAVGWVLLLRNLRRHYADIPLRPLPPTGAELRLLAVKAPLYAVQQASFVVIAHAPVALLGRLAAPAEIVSFVTARTFTGLVRQMARQISTSVGMEVARMHACGDQAGARRLFTGSMPLLGCAIALMAGAAWAGGPAVFALWTHGAIPFDPLIGAAFLAGALLQAPAYGAAGVMRLVDRPGIVAIIHASEIAMALALVTLSIPWAGAAGAALAITIAETMTTTPWSIQSVGRLLNQAVLWPALRTYAVTAFTFAFVLLAALVAGWIAPLTTVNGLALFAALWTAGALPALLMTLSEGQRADIWRRLQRAPPGSG